MVYIVVQYYSHADNYHIAAVTTTIINLCIYVHIRIRGLFGTATYMTIIIMHKSKFIAQSTWP